ncbi:MAG: imelysin family protein [Pseudomonadota bacterium]
MIRFFFAGIMLMVFASSAAAEPSKEITKTVMSNAARNFIQPAYSELVTSSLELKDAVVELCQDPSKERLQKARGAFSKTVEKWSAIELLRFGLITQENRLERILFYPDRKSTGLKQVQRILANSDQTAVAVETLKNKSVAVQGLGALEFLLFGTDSETIADGNKFRCNYATAVSMNISNISSELSDDWLDDSETMRIWGQPGPGNPVLKKDLEAVNELLGLMVHGLEAIRDIRIGAFLRSEAKKDRPRVAIFRRSENTVAVLENNIRAVRQLFEMSDAGLLLKEEDQGIYGNIVFELKNAENVAAQIPVPLSESLKDPDIRERIVYLRTSVNFAIEMLDQDFAKAAGLSSGFSFSDGD